MIGVNNMKNQVLGTYTVRQTGNANSVTIPASAGLRKGDNVVLILKPDGNLEIKKKEEIFGTKHQSCPLKKRRCKSRIWDMIH
ncbi:hypothetical protein LBJG_00324 [Lactobacillus jensenii 1153]|nr:hypothetical protein LBJG_00324 [Lactobacillus jensenii 1153]